MKIDVVHEEHARLLHRREQACDFFGQRRDLLGGRALGGEPGGADFQDPARLVHLLAGEAVQRREKAQGVGVERRRTLGNVRARAVARSDDAHGRQRAQAGANRRTADADLRREIAFGGKPIAGLERAALDEVAHVGDHLTRAASRCAEPALPAELPLRLADLDANGACGHKCGVRLSPDWSRVRLQPDPCWARRQPDREPAPSIDAEPPSCRLHTLPCFGTRT